MYEDKWCYEWFINKKVIERNEIICNNYPNLSIEFLAKKYYITPLYVLFILKRAGKELLVEHENMIKNYVTDEFPFPEQDNGFIYKIYNDLDDMIYIGQTNQTLLMRFKQHIREYKESRYAGRKLHQHFDLIGTEHFNIKLIEEVPLKELNNKEKYWIKYFDSFRNGLNGTPGGDYNRQEFF